MVSTFSNLEIARRAIFAQNSAITTTGHNIANANTDGYSRQRVNLTTTEPFPGVGFNQPAIPGQLGTGVEAGSVQRIRDTFIDQQVRTETTKNGYWSSKSEVLGKVETIMNEPTDTGLSSVMDQFWQSIQDLANNPTNAGAKATVAERGKSVADTFHYLYGSLQDVRSNLKDEMKVTASQVNAITDQINNLNKQIAEVEPNGMLPNDLYDKRDLLVDKLSEYGNVKVTRVQSGGNASKMAEGAYTVSLVGQSGQQYTLVDGNSLTNQHINAQFTKSDTPDAGGIYEKFDGFKLGNGINMSLTGKLQGQAEAYNKDTADMMSGLNEMAKNLVTAFNEVHRAGYGTQKDAAGNPAAETGNDFFKEFDPASDKAGVYAQYITLDQKIIDSPDNIASASANSAGTGSAGPGDNGNALDLADVLDKKEMPFTVYQQNIGNTTQSTNMKEYLENMVGQMGVNTQAANRLTENTQTLMDTAEQRRQSVSGVSVDEEMTHLIEYQHSYNAAAKMISTINDMLDVLVNQVGR